MFATAFYGGDRRLQQLPERPVQGFARLFRADVRRRHRSCRPCRWASRRNTRPPRRPYSSRATRACSIFLRGGLARRPLLVDRPAGHAPAVGPASGVPAIRAVPRCPHPLPVAHDSPPSKSSSPPGMSRTGWRSCSPRILTIATSKAVPPAPIFRIRIFSTSPKTTWRNPASSRPARCRRACSATCRRRKNSSTDGGGRPSMGCAKRRSARRWMARPRACASRISAGTCSTSPKRDYCRTSDGCCPIRAMSATAG